MFLTGNIWLLPKESRGILPPRDTAEVMTDTMQLNLRLVTVGSHLKEILAGLPRLFGKLDKGVVHILGGAKLDGARFHHTTQRAI